MTINLNIKANVDNLTLAEIYELLAKYSRETKKTKTTSMSSRVTFLK